MLSPAVARLLKRARIKPKDIDLYAISIGPGSFTGLRIGVAFIKGMNLFANKPVVCVPTLDAMASMIKAEIVCPIIDAKRQNVYTAIYKNGQRILKYSVIPICEILEIIKGRGTLQRAPTFAFTGDGIDVYKDEIINVLGEKAVFAEKRLWHTSADNIAKIGYRMYNENKGVIRDLSELVPMYLYPRDIQCRKA
jgi:tRNA threonylcarbamoyladenosine biosynthesis protein TsaB